MSTLRQAVPHGQADPGRNLAEEREEVQATRTAAPRARRLVSAALHQWGLEGLADAAVQIASELAANGGSSGGPVQVCVRRTRRLVIVEVSDTSPAAPPRPPRRVSAAAERGRGLMITRKLARDLAWYPCDGGKVVWASIPAPRARRQPARITLRLIRRAA